MNRSFSHHNFHDAYLYHRFSTCIVTNPFEKDIIASRLHATLMLKGSHYRIYDAGNTSGTWVNEQPEPESGLQLMDEDEIFLVTIHLRFCQLESNQFAGFRSLMYDPPTLNRRSIHGRGN